VKPPHESQTDTYSSLDEEFEEKKIEVKAKENSEEINE